jgi:hypothetical protein
MLTQNAKPKQKRIIPRTGSNKNDYELHDRRIINVLVDVNLQQLEKNIPKHDPEYGITMKELKDRTHFNRNTLRKHLLVGLKKNLPDKSVVQIYPPLLGTVVTKKNNRYFLEPAAKIFPIWEYLANEFSTKLVMKGVCDYHDFFYKNTIVFVPNTQDMTYDIMCIPLAEWQKYLKVLHIQEME